MLAVLTVGRSIDAVGWLMGASRASTPMSRIGAGEHGPLAPGTADESIGGYDIDLDVSRRPEAWRINPKTLRHPAPSLPDSTRRPQDSAQSKVTAAAEADTEKQTRATAAIRAFKGSLRESPRFRRRLRA